MNKVAWYTGLSISQHHFQVQDAYSEHLIQKAKNFSDEFLYGTKNIIVDQSKLEQGIICITKLEAILPNGDSILLPGSDADQLILRLDAGISDISVYLALPKILQNGKYIAKDKDSMSSEKYYLEEFKAYDAILGAEQIEPIQVLKPNYRLVTNPENFQSYDLLKLLQVKEVSSNGTIILDSDYIPPVISISANDKIMGYLKDILTLSQKRRKQLLNRLKDIDNYGMAGVMELLLLQLLNKYQPILNHLSLKKRASPEQLYQIFLSLSSELRTFTNDERGYDETNVPLYVHTKLGNTFKILVDDLRESFNYVFEEKARKIELDYLSKYGIYTAALDNFDLSHGQWGFVLACKTEIPKDQLSIMLPKIIKIASREEIVNVVNKQLPGIAVKAMPSAAKQIPFLADYVYFELDENSDYWKSIREIKALSICLTKRFSHIDLQLWAIKI